MRHGNGFKSMILQVVDYWLLRIISLAFVVSNFGLVRNLQNNPLVTEDNVPDNDEFKIVENDLITLIIVKNYL